MLLRIDTSIQIAGANADDGAIVVAVTTMAHAFGRKVIAEGAESIEPIRRLIDIGCLQGQGYGIARPMPADEVLAWMSRYRQNPGT